MPEAALGLRFKVVIDGFNLGSWTKCEGLSVEYDVHEYNEGGQNGFVHRLPGRAKYQNVKLTRTMDTTSASVARWLSSVQAGARRQTAHIAVLDAAGTEVMSWSFLDVIPVRWTGPTLDVGSSQVATETLELAHNGFLGSW